uniref:Uncharacterized protein n=1 Tax=Arundo donax TaxID=35708 RepID=A0A0A8Z2N1_ARUDO
MINNLLTIEILSLIAQHKCGPEERFPCNKFEMLTNLYLEESSGRELETPGLTNVQQNKKE